MGKEPESVRELYFYMEGQFSTINERLENIENKRNNGRAVASVLGALFGGMVAGAMSILKK